MQHHILLSLTLPALRPPPTPSDGHSITDSRSSIQLLWWIKFPFTSALSITWGILSCFLHSFIYCAFRAICSCIHTTVLFFYPPCLTPLLIWYSTSVHLLLHGAFHYRLCSVFSFYLHLESNFFPHFSTTSCFLAQVQSCTVSKKPATMFVLSSPAVGFKPNLGWTPIAG